MQWFLNQGYAFAEVEANRNENEDRTRADIRVFVDLGPRGRFGDIIVEGIENVEESVVLRELPFETGDRFSFQDLLEGQRQLFGLGLFTVALANVAPDQPEDETVDILVRVQEGDPRIVTAQTGYLQQAGLSGSAQWTNRNFSGGARTLTAAVQAQTGLLATQGGGNQQRQSAQILYRGSVSFRQPYVFNRNTAFITTPYAEYYDDVRAEATAFGIDNTLLYEFGSFRTISLTYGISTRNVLNQPNLEAAGLIESLQNALSADSLEGRFFKSTFGISGAFGTVDDPLNPTRGFLVRPSIRVATPSFLSSVEYLRLGTSATGYLPLSDSPRVSLFGRISGGYLLPFGKSSPSTREEGIFDIFSLRDEVFFSGGTGDVRGWGANLLGPKGFETNREGDRTLSSSDDHAAGRASTKYRARSNCACPFPSLGPNWGTAVFLDAGRVGTSDENLQIPAPTPALDALNQSAVRFGTGGGIEYLTPIGALRIALGYKLNPSYLDVRDANAVFQVVETARAENRVPTRAEFEAVPIPTHSSLSTST